MRKKHRPISTIERLVWRRDDGLGRKLDPLHTIVQKNIFKTWIETAFRKPETLWILTEYSSMGSDAYSNLSVDSSWIILIQRKKSMGSSRCHQLNVSLFA